MTENDESLTSDEIEFSELSPSIPDQSIDSAGNAQDTQFSMYTLS